MALAVAPDASGSGGISPAMEVGGIGCRTQSAVSDIEKQWFPIRVRVPEPAPPVTTGVGRSFAPFNETFNWVRPICPRISPPLLFAV